MILLFH
jgi:hypothetical protein